MRQTLTKLLSLVLCATLVVSFTPGLSYAGTKLSATGADLAATGAALTAADDSAATEITMTEGEVIAGFVAAGTKCTSQDPTIAWVDSSGNLNAMKVGTTTISVAAEAGDPTVYTVTVNDYTDGSEVVGNLKILARYNDSMQFYDGHVYLLFTSYQDGVTINVDDLYGAYAISDQYYDDINESIANGSNHTGNDTGKYFAFTDDMKSVTLNRGEIVTIGMYRGFDLTVAQAALGMLTNSSAWTGIVTAGKADVVYDIFDFLQKGKISSEGAFWRLEAVLDELGDDYMKYLDGVVEGGVCFNRELYNQKLEWDQFENVTYELDITKKQLNTMAAYLGGNLDNFSIMKNSCATVALRAWNAAVGIRDGVDTAYKLSAAGEGIYSIFDAPKGVRDNIVERLPGYYLNNAQGVAEPNAGFQDETGYVYVSAPEKVNPLTYTYTDNSLQIDTTLSDMPKLIATAKGEASVVYGIDEQQVGVTINKSAQDSATAVNSIDFAINGANYSLDNTSAIAGNLWLKAQVANPVEGESYYVIDAAGKTLASSYADGWVSFYAEALPATFKVVGSTTGTLNLLSTTIVKPEEADATTEVYYKSGDTKTTIDGTAQVSSGTKVFVASKTGLNEVHYVLSDITLNGTSILNAANYDAEEGAYFFLMPESFATLTATYDKAEVTATKGSLVQVGIGDTLDIADYAQLLIGEQAKASSDVKWLTLAEVEGTGVVDYADSTHKQLIAKAEGSIGVWACAENNSSMGVLILIEVNANMADMVKVTYTDSDTDGLVLTAAAPGATDAYAIPCSGYFVKKGSTIEINPAPAQGNVVSELTCNGNGLKPGETVVANEDIAINASFQSATVKGMPSIVELKAKGDKYRLSASVHYAGILTQFLPVYDSSIRYESSDPLVAVDEKGVVTVVGDVPEGGKAVIITAYAGSSNDTVFAQSKVTVGDYQGSKIVGNLTLSARRIYEGELVAHSAATFRTYEDIDLDVSYYYYYKPTEKLIALLEDYEDHPENYNSDPTLYNDNELGLVDRESYFETITHGALSDPDVISLQTGECITVSNYSFDSTNLETVYRTLLNSTISKSSESAPVLINYVGQYIEGKNVDTSETFDSLIATFLQMRAVTVETGHNPADGLTIGGACINREMFNQFRRNDLQTPNNYYTVDITADELAVLRGYLANPNNNFYSLFNKNCGAGVVDLWNLVLADRPELTLKANYSGFGADPESMYFALGLLGLQKGLDGEGGSDFYPRSVPSRCKWAVSGSGNTLTAACSNTNIYHHYGECENVTNGYPVTIEATACDYDHVALAGSIDQFNEIMGTNVAATDEYVKFYRTDTKGATTGGTEVAAGTTDDGFYYAELTVNGQSAQAAFKVGNPKEGPTPEEASAQLDAQLAANTDAIMAMKGISDLKKDAAVTSMTSVVALAKILFVLFPTYNAVETARDSALSSMNATLREAQDSDPGYVKAKNRALLNKGSSMKIAKGALNLEWGVVPDADGYDVFAKKGVKGGLKNIVATVDAAQTAISLEEIDGKAINKTKRYSAAVKAFKMVDGKKVYLAKSLKFRAIPQANKKFTNPSNVVVSKDAVNLAVGGTDTIKVTVKKDGKKSLLKQAKKAKLISSDTNVAKVTNKGVITALEPGTCEILCIAANGVQTVVNVTVAGK